MSVAIDVTDSLIARFEAKVERSSGCWLWLGASTSEGYGRLWLGGGSATTAPRVAFSIHVGPIPVGLEIDHLCRNPPCVRPDHLEAVTHRINDLRGVGVSARHAVKTQCPVGHPYDEPNTGIGRQRTGVRRRCRACDRIQQAARRARERVA